MRAILLLACSSTAQAVLPPSPAYPVRGISWTGFRANEHPQPCLVVDLNRVRNFFPSRVTRFLCTLCRPMLSHSLSSMSRKVLPLLVPFLGLASCLEQGGRSVRRDLGSLEAAYDYVVVGGGTSGLVVASRLSENEDSTSRSHLH